MNVCVVVVAVVVEIRGGRINVLYRVDENDKNKHNPPVQAQVCAREHVFEYPIRRNYASRR